MKPGKTEFGVIKDNVPPPEKVGKGGYTDLIRSMKVGQWLALPTTRGSVRALCSSVERASKDGRKYQCGRVEGGTQIWRIK